MEAWENSEAPQGFYKLLENVNDNKYSNPQVYLKDVDGLVHLALQRIKEKDGKVLRSMVLFFFCTTGLSKHLLSCIDILFHQDVGLCLTLLVSIHHQSCISSTFRQS